jgi:hypothetical protein
LPRDQLRFMSADLMIGLGAFVGGVVFNRRQVPVGAKAVLRRDAF